MFVGEIREQSEQKNPPLQCRVDMEPGGQAAIHVSGYGDYCGIGPIAVLDYWEGELRLVVFGDINSEDPTHIINLNGALKANHNPEI